MTLVTLCFGALILKGLIQLPFAYSSWRSWSIVTMASILFWAPMLKVLYHETQIDFLMLFVLHLLVEFALLWRVVRLSIWKASLTSFLYSLLFFLYFLIGNG